MSRPQGSTKPTCKRGHVIAEVGRYSSGCCKGCAPELSRRSRANAGRRTLDALDRTMIDTAPLLPFLRRRGWSDGQPGADTAYRIMKGRSRISLAKADELCIRMGYHPALVFGDAWWVE